MRLILPILLVFALSSCGPSFTVPEGGVDRNEYLRSLGRAGILDSQRATEWQEAAERALANPEELEPPFSEGWSIEEGTVEAAEGYRFELPGPGEVRLTVTLQGEGFAFLDLYTLREGEPEFIFSTSRGEATFKARRDRVYIVRVQPEIYAEGRVSIQVRPME